MDSSKIQNKMKKKREEKQAEVYAPTLEPYQFVVEGHKSIPL